jgi:hypothetical protein
MSKKLFEKSEIVSGMLAEARDSHATLLNQYHAAALQFCKTLTVPAGSLTGEQVKAITSDARAMYREDFGDAYGSYSSYFADVIVLKLAGDAPVTFKGQVVNEAGKKETGDVDSTCATVAEDATRSKHDMSRAAKERRDELGIGRKTSPRVPRPAGASKAASPDRTQRPTNVQTASSNDIAGQVRALFEVSGEAAVNTLNRILSEHGYSVRKLPKKKAA